MEAISDWIGDLEQEKREMQARIEALERERSEWQLTLNGYEKRVGELERERDEALGKLDTYRKMWVIADDRAGAAEMRARRLETLLADQVLAEMDSEGQGSRP